MRSDVFQAPCQFPPIVMLRKRWNRAGATPSGVWSHSPALKVQKIRMLICVVSISACIVRVGAEKGWERAENALTTAGEG